ncbi:MAG: hypothetical protein A2583_04560 [Bdellovibrionales bacterium RIFOXYD1_FULL_53_11]|nr:MAG: hypothetical protein A2583_04560 [Bdellovibrionales bacterium RIFOXYD1_FULL_53_11]
MFVVSSVLLGLWVVSSGFILDPSDDFSFSFAAASERVSYRLMRVDHVAGLLGERLDMFPKSQTKKLARHIVGLCRRYKFDPAFVLSVIEVESSFRIKVVSSAGAVGLMQVMPATAQVVADRYRIRYTGTRSLTDPFTNVSIGVAYLAHLRDLYRDLSPYFHVAAYNIGPARLDELRVQRGFKPVKTKVYYQAIRNGVPYFRIAPAIRHDWRRRVADPDMVI